MLVETWRRDGLLGCARKLRAALWVQVVPRVRGGRTVSSVAAYFDLVTDEGRLFYGDSFHLGYFVQGDEDLQAALDAHTDLVADLARIAPGARVLDLGCGIGEPALRIASLRECEVIALNVSREQVRQGRELIAARQMSRRVQIRLGNALALPFADATFDAVVCLEVGGDVCTTASAKRRLVAEVRRVLRRGGHVGFTDLAFTRAPSASEDRILRAVLHHAGGELVTNWSELFRGGGFDLVECHDIIEATHTTWRRALDVYETRAAEVEARYGRRTASRLRAHIAQIPDILARYGTYPAFSARKP
ncbi:MAG TPA: methyltransferase domain-containing protein [Myxococcales bacterium]|nr:methyltransferase domain-containing protein [Myxococcales bacterium]